MTSRGDWAIVEQIIQRLKRRKQGFGTRPGSYSVEVDTNRFVSYVLSLQIAQDLLPFEGAEDAGQALTHEQQQQLSQVVDRVDRYGGLVVAWRQGRPPSPPCLADLQVRLEHWALRHLPAYCLEGMDLRRLVASLATGLEGQVTGYDYGQDLLTWAVPHLVHALWDQVAEIARLVRPELDVADLETRLVPAARVILARIHETYGIHGLSADEVVARTLRLLLGAAEEEYAAHRYDVDAWATARLKEQIKIRVLYRTEPQAGPDWFRDPTVEEAELQKRRQILWSFCHSVR